MQLLSSNQVILSLIQTVKCKHVRILKIEAIHIERTIGFLVQLGALVQLYCIHTYWQETPPPCMQTYAFCQAPLPFLCVCSLCREEMCAQESIRMCTFVCMSDCSDLFGIACEIKDLSIHNTEFLVVEASQVSHLGHIRVKQSYESKR